MSILQLPQAVPTAILMDWHATLVDTHDAMYHAIDDVLPRLEALGLRDRLLTTEQSKTLEDARLVKYVRDHHRLHPKITAQRKISRTDIFEVLFGSDQDAKARIHAAFDDCYKKYVDDVHALEPDTTSQLRRLRELGIPMGIISNRKRDYLEHELSRLEDGAWIELFDVIVCGDDVAHRKPAPDMLLEALRRLGQQPGPTCWYLGDSTTDVIAGKDAGVTAVFYNGAQWSQSWLDKIFPSSPRHPHRPDAVVTRFGELVRLVRDMVANGKRVQRATEAAFTPPEGRLREN